MQIDEGERVVARTDHRELVLRVVCLRVKQTRQQVEQIDEGERVVVPTTVNWYLRVVCLCVKKTEQQVKQIDEGERVVVPTTVNWYCVWFVCKHTASTKGADR